MTPCLLAKKKLTGTLFYTGILVYKPVLVVQSIFRVTAQGAHISSVSVYVRNIKKCMGEY